MRGELSPPRPTPNKPVGGEIVLCRVPNFAGMETPGTPASTELGRCEVRMVEGIEELTIQSQRHPFPNRNALCQVDIRIGEMRTRARCCVPSFRIGSCNRVASSAGPSGGIHYGAKGVGIQPLPGARYGHTRIRSLAVEGNAGNPYGQTAARWLERYRDRSQCRAG